MSLKIYQWWPTPVHMGGSPFSEETMSALREAVIWGQKTRMEVPPVFQQHPLPQVPSQTFRKSYNLFIEKLPTEFQKPIEEVKTFVRGLYIQYLKEAYGIDGIDDLQISARCFGDVHVRGERTSPHYHHTCDHVFVLYLDCGENRENKNKGGDGELVLQDPRLFSTFPFWDKVKTIDTRKGVCLLHPAYLWHESNAMNADGTRVVMVITLKTESHNYTDLYSKI